MKKTRRQLTLFLDEAATALVEKIRETFNPKQHQLIPSHITLCREDEIEDLATVQKNLAELKVKPFHLELGPPRRFYEGKGVFLPVQDDQGQFKNLRVLVLKQVITKLRDHEPHITLMHPRNSTCTDLIFESIQRYELPLAVHITTISLIEQEIGEKWRVLKQYNLR